MQLTNSSECASAQIYDTPNVAKLLNVDLYTVMGWIDSGKLEAVTTYGGFHEIRLESLLKFIKNSNMPVPAGLCSNVKKSILIIDDDDCVLNTIKSVLKKMPAQYDIITSNNGYQAGSLLHQHKPQLLILDLMLNGIASVSISNAIKKSGMPIKILGISGFDSEEHKRQMLDSGADDYLGKPFNVDELLQKVRMLMND